MLALISAGCGEPDECGPGQAPAVGIVFTAPELMAGELRYGNATSGVNNDCSVESAPTSLTLAIGQVEPLTANRRELVLCVPRPDQLDAPLALTDDAVTTGVQVIDLFGEEGDCLYSLDRSRAVTGTATFAGVCDNGTATEGFSLALSGQIPVSAVCATVPSTFSLSMAGEVAVAIE